MFNLDFFSITFFIAITVNLLFMFFLLRHDRKNIKLRSLIYLFSLISVWLFIEFLSIYLNLSEESSILLWKILFVLVGLVTLNLFRSVSLLLERRARKIVKIFFISIYLLTFFSILFTNYVISGIRESLEFSVLYQPGTWFSVVVLILLFPVFASCVFLFLKIFSLKKENHTYKMQLIFVLLGILFTFLNGLFVALIEPLLNFDVPKLFHISITFATFFFFYAIYKYQAFDIKNDFFISLRTKIFLGVLLVSLIPFLFVVSYVSKFSTDILKDNSVKNLEDKVSNIAENTNVSLSSLSQEVSFLATVPPIQGIIRARDNQGIDPYDNSTYDVWVSRLNEIFYHLEESRPGVFMQLRYLDEAGNELVRVDSTESGEVKIIEKEKLQNKADRYYFIEAMKLAKGQIYVSPLDLNKEGQPPKVQVPYMPVIRYAVPVFDLQNNRKGIVIANIFADSFLDKFSEEEEAFNKDYGAKIYLINKEGFYFYNEDKTKEWGGPDDLNTLKNFSFDFPKYYTEVLSGKTGYILEDNDVFAYTPIFYNKNSDDFWVIFTSSNRSVIFSSLNFLKNNLYIVTLVLLILIFVVSRLIARSFTKPLFSLKEGTNIVKAGNLDYRVANDRDDEIGILSKSFDSMTIALQDSYQKIDEKVHEQTKKLREQKKQLEENQEKLVESLDIVKKQKQKAQRLARELEISSRRFASAFEESAIGMALVSLEGKFLDVNDSLCKMLEYSKKELLKMTFQEITFPADLEADLSFVKKLLEGKQNSYEMNKRYLKKNGDIFWIQLNGSIVRDDDKNPLFFIAQIQDISERMAIDKAKSEFVSLASHQLRTPLSAINWNIELLLNDKKLTKKQKEILTDVFSYSNGMVSLVNSLLNVSRLEMGNFLVEPKETDLKKLLNNLLKQFKPDLEKKKIKLTKKYSKKLPKTKVDTKLLEIVLQNLISNAIKYTPKSGEVKIEIKTDEDDFKIIVDDSGCGIPKKQQDKIFTKMFRAENAQKIDPNGNGLGLYISKMILDNSGGKISFESSNSGTTFTVEIPQKGMKARKGSKQLV